MKARRWYFKQNNMVGYSVTDYLKRVLKNRNNYRLFRYAFENM